MSNRELKRQVTEAIGRRDFLLAESLCRHAEGRVAAADLLFIRGVLYSARGDLENACLALARAHQELPERPDIAYNYGVVLQQSGRMVEATKAWKKTTFYAPQNVAAWVNLALGTQQLGDTAAAYAIYRDALKRHPTHRDLLYNYANLLCRDGKLEESERHYQKLLKFHRADAKAWINYGMLLKTAGRFSESEACCRQAIAVGDQTNTARAHFNLANLLLQQGRWRDGFAAYQWRLKLPDAANSPWALPEWTPALPKGSRLLLWNDQGQGDAIMFLRFASMLADRGYRLFAFVQDSLKTLAATAAGIEASFGPSDEPQELDASLPLCSLPYVLGLESIDVWKGPYLSVSQGCVFQLSERSDSGKRVGIVWAGNPKHLNDANRSMDIAHFAPLLKLSGVEWYSLQVGDRVSELASSPYRAQVRDLAHHLEDFAATASVIEKLDLLISIDSAPAHLAGALGVPVWTLLPCVDTDWRWQTKGERTLWYPTMRLFRQPRIGDWGTVVSDIVDALRNEAALSPNFSGLSEIRPD